MTKTKTGKSQSRNGSSRKTSDVQAIIEDEYGNYRIRAGRLSGNFVARAFPKSQSKSQGLMAEASGASEAEAIEALKALLKAREGKRVAAWRWEERSEVPVPSTDEYIEALRQTALSTTQLAMIKAQALAGENGLTLTGLMSAAGYKSQDAAAKALARAGGLVADFLGIEVPAGSPDDTSDGRRVLGFRQLDTRGDRETWVMHEELRNAVWATL